MNDEKLKVWKDILLEDCEVTNNLKNRHLLTLIGICFINPFCAKVKSLLP